MSEVGGYSQPKIPRSKWLKPFPKCSRAENGACVGTTGIAHFHGSSQSIKVAYTSCQIFEKFMNGYPIFSVEKIYHQVDEIHK